jgi:hypothetical protein
MEILSYHILTANSADALAGNLQSAIKSGWQPFGGLQTASLKDGSVSYAQAIVQYVPKAD